MATDVIAVASIYCSVELNPELDVSCAQDRIIGGNRLLTRWRLTETLLQPRRYIVADSVSTESPGLLATYDLTIISNVRPSGTLSSLTFDGVYSCIRLRDLHLNVDCRTVTSPHFDWKGTATLASPSCSFMRPNRYPIMSKDWQGYHQTTGCWGVATGPMFFWHLQSRTRTSSNLLWVWCCSLPAPQFPFPLTSCWVPLQRTSNDSASSPRHLILLLHGPEPAVARPDAG